MRKVTESKPVFCVISAKTCGHCVAFRKNWPEIRQAIENTGLVRIVDVELETPLDIPDPTKYPDDLVRFSSRWVPMFILFTGSSWDATDPLLGNATNGGRLEGVVFNSKIKDGQLFHEFRQVPSKDNLLRWIKDELQGDLFKRDREPVMPLLSSGVPDSSRSLPFLSSPAIPPPAAPDIYPSPGTPSVCSTKYRPKNTYRRSRIKF